MSLQRNQADLSSLSNLINIDCKYFKFCKQNATLDMKICQAKKLRIKLIERENLMPMTFTDVEKHH